MATFIGVNPGGKSSFAVTGLYWAGRFPAMLIMSEARSGVHEVMDDIVGVCGEWDQLSAVCIDGPLSWSGRPGGARTSDQMMRRRVVSWAPGTWFRSPNVMPASRAIQGPALTWALSREIRAGQLPKHRVLETHARFGLSRIASDLQDSVVGYRDRRLSATARQTHVRRLFDRLFDTGIVKCEISPPSTADEMDALIAAVAGLGYCMPETGIAVTTLPPGDLRPVGKRPIALLQALP